MVDSDTWGPFTWITLTKFMLGPLILQGHCIMLFYCRGPVQGSTVRVLGAELGNIVNTSRVTPGILSACNTTMPLPRTLAFEGHNKELTITVRIVQFFVYSKVNLAIYIRCRCLLTMVTFILPPHRSYSPKSRALSSLLTRIPAVRN